MDIEGKVKSIIAQHFQEKVATNGFGAQAESKSIAIATAGRSVTTSSRPA